MVWSSLEREARWPIMVSFSGTIKNPNFHWYLNPFCWRLLRPMLLFGKLVDETQIYKPHEPARHQKSIKLLLLILLPLRAIYFRPYHYETPCSWYLTIQLFKTFFFNFIRISFALIEFKRGVLSSIGSYCGWSYRRYYWRLHQWFGSSRWLRVHSNFEVQVRVSKLKYNFD